MKSCLNFFFHDHLQLGERNITTPTPALSLKFEVSRLNGTANQLDGNLAFFPILYQLVIACRKGQTGTLEGNEKLLNGGEVVQFNFLGMAFDWLRPTYVKSIKL